QWEQAGKLFKDDPTLREEFDYFAAYTSPDSPRFEYFGSSNVEHAHPDAQLVAFLLKDRSMKRGETRLIVNYSGHAYIVSVAALADTSGNPFIPGVAVFAHRLDRLLSSAQEILPVTFALSNSPDAEYLALSLTKDMRPGDAPLYVHIKPNSTMTSLTQTVLAALILVQILITTIVFVILTPRFIRNRTAELEQMVKASDALNDELTLRLEQLNVSRLEVQKSEKKYRDLVESSREIIFSLDAFGKITTMNQAVSRLLGYTPESLIGRSFLDLIFKTQDQSAGFRDQFVKERIQEVVETQKPVEFVTEFATRYDEPRELHATLEYVSSDDGFVIFGKVASLVEDVLLNYCERENMKYVIGNFLTLSEQISHRITTNLTRYCDTNTALQIRICVSEIIINAIEHGNLGITYEEKTDATENGVYFEFLKRRQTDPTYSTRRVTILYALSPRRVSFMVSDEGNGFDHKKISQDNSREANTSMHLHGRGITMAKHAFDTLRYNDAGNRVLLVKKF
ncbi:MAG: ATP-binding protein, partial [Spirochaetia bacterium]|nr:ATP-binding protein [Spirochaetia bacterium]